MQAILVLMSTYNGAQYLKEQLNSILNQVNVNVTLLIRDDGSSDSTKNIIEYYIGKYHDRIILYCGKNIGFAMSFTELLRIAYDNFPNYKYYAFADQDDVWKENKLSQAIKQLKSFSNEIPVSYCSNATLVDAKLNYIGELWRKDIHITKSGALIQNRATGCTMVFNRKAVELYVTHLPKVVKVHDFLMFQICVFLGQIVCDKQSYINYRQHGNNQIGKPNFYKRMRIRTKGKYKEHVLEMQSRNFLEAFKDLLSVDDIALICRVAYYRLNIFTRLSLFFDKNICYNTFEANFFYKLKVIAGWL